MTRPLDGIRVLEVAQFAPNAVGMHLADLGADVIKLEAPGIGDPSRLLGKPYKGESLASRRWNRGKQSMSVDLRTEAGAALFRALVHKVDAVIEGMRPGALDRRGLGYERLISENPQLVFVSLSGWGESGPYRNLGSHGLAFDAFAGLAPPRDDVERPTRPAGHVWQGLEAGPLYGALAVVSAILQAKQTGEPSRIEVSQADAGAVWNGWQIAYESAKEAKESRDRQSQSRETPAPASELLEAYAASAEIEDSGGAGAIQRQDGPLHDVRYQYYAARDGVILLMATEQRFWENFCRGLDRLDLYERWPGIGYADHDYGNEALREELDRIFATRTQLEWIDFFITNDVAGGPVHKVGETFRDPHFESRDLWTDPAIHTVRMPGTPIRIDGVRAIAQAASPKHAEHTDQILERLLGYDAKRILALREDGVLGEEK